MIQLTLRKMATATRHAPSVMKKAIVFVRVVMRMDGDSLVHVRGPRTAPPSWCGQRKNSKEGAPGKARYVEIEWAAQTNVATRAGYGSPLVA
jgi:hypothetical protein